jgi:hypothetical protein
MRWPWTKPKPPATAAPEDHSAEARSLLRQLDEQQPHVDQVTDELARYKRANHLTQRIAAALYGRPDAPGSR